MCTTPRSRQRALGVKYSVISIEGMFEATLAALKASSPARSRIRRKRTSSLAAECSCSWASRTRRGACCSTTGNKSEMAVGYATLYGDMAGGFAPIKDCSKMLVYRLSNYRNSISRVIPQRVIDRPPSAELRPDQEGLRTRSARYEVLDAILEAFIEEDLSVDEIVSARFRARDRSGRVLDLGEAQRVQAPGRHRRACA